MFSQDSAPGVQLLASNLEFLLRYLANEVPQMPLPGLGSLNPQSNGGGALALSALAQKQGGAL